MSQERRQNIENHGGPCITDMQIIIDGRPTYIDRDFSLIDRNKDFSSPGKAVLKVKFLHVVLAIETWRPSTFR